jgi:signal transduction histidine kinase
LRKILLPFLLLIFNNLLSQTEEGKFVKYAYITCEKNHKQSFFETIDFFVEKNYDSTYVYASKALTESFSINEKNIFNYLQGVSAFRKRMFKKAIHSISKIEKSEFNELKYFQLGLINVHLKKYKKSISHLSNLVDFKTDDKSFKKKIFHGLGVSNIHLKNYKKAEIFFNREFNLIEEIDTLGLITLKMDLANVYYNQYLDEKAIPLFKEAYDLAKIYSNIELKHNTSKNMAIVERNRKHYKESVGYFDEYVKWKDSIWNRDKIWELTEKDKKIAVAQKQQEIVVQNEQIKRQKVVQKGLLFGASGLLVFLGGLAFFYKKLKSKNKLITEQKEALNISNKTKNYLFSVVSHDLRSPINSIKRQHQKLAKHIANNDLPAIKEATKSAIAVTESTSHLLNNVLHWSLEQSNQLNFSQEEHVLQPVIEHVLFDYEDLAEAKDISISSDLESDIVVLTDKESLKIVFRNLIDNSIKYMDGSGSISVKTEKHSETHARIEIKDSGIGISEEKLQKINALKDLSIDKIDRSKGIGLGLLLCQTLIKKNNGTLFFKSKEGTSTTAVILLPLA